MAKFTYQATDAKGAPRSGNVEASDKSAAVALLAKQGLKPHVIKEASSGFDPNNIQLSFLKSKKVKSKDIVVFTRQLSTMINAGVPLVRALATLQDQTESDVLKEALQEVSKDVESGTAFADAIGKHKTVFSEVYINMVRAGEAGGILDDILKRLAHQQEKQASMRKKIKSASTYPMVLVAIMVLAFFGMMIFVIPQIGGIIKDLGGEDAELPIYTQAMLNLSAFMIKQWYLFAIIIFGGLFGFRRYIKTPKGKKWWHGLLLKLPVLKNLVAKIAISRFARTFASLMSSGVSMLDALSVTGGAIGNVVIEEDLKKAAAEVQNGRQLSEPISQSKYFPPIVAQMLAIGEETGQVDTILLKVADFYEEEVDTIVDSLSSIIEPIMIVALGGMVGLIAASVMGPISELTQNI